MDEKNGCHDDERKRTNEWATRQGMCEGQIGCEADKKGATKRDMESSGKQLRARRTSHQAA